MKLVVIGNGVALSTRHQKPLRRAAASDVFTVEAVFDVKSMIVPTTAAVAEFALPPWTCTPPAEPGVSEAI